MNDTFNKTLWELGSTSPEVQNIIANSIATNRGYYSIPTGNVLEQAHQLEDPEQKATALDRIAHTQSLTVGELATKLELISLDLKELEENGTELNPAQRTLKDLDIITLAYYIEHIQTKPQAFDTVEEFERARYGYVKSSNNEEGYSTL